MKKGYLTTPSLTKIFSSISINLVCLLIAGFLFGFQGYAQTSVTAINTNSVAATPFSYTVGGITYNWGLDTDMFLVSVEVGADTYIYDNNFTPKKFELKRIDNANSTGFRNRLMVEKTAVNFDYKATFPSQLANGSAMESALSEPIINRGALDVFQNVDDTNQQFANNIERIDVVYKAFRAPSLSDEIGYLVSEKNGNNGFKIAAITSLDASGEPASYGPLVTIDLGNYGEPNAALSWEFLQSLANPPHGDPSRYFNSTERQGISLITFDQLGIGSNDLVYGISVFGIDVTGGGGQNLLDPSTFPQNTIEGADIFGGLGTIVKTSGVVVDSDNDGIPDYADLDNDNDGILDVDEGALTNRDTDGDTIPDYLDRDSDNDGCYDSLEGDGGYTFADVDISAGGSLGSLTFPVDANGVPGGVANAQSSTANLTDPTMVSLVCDTDGDGVSPLVDLDNDNDGIPNLEEACDPIYPFTNGNGGGTHTSNFTNPTIAVIDFITLDDSAIIDIDGNPVHAATGLSVDLSTLQPGYVNLEFRSDGSQITTPWIANTNGLPRFRISIDFLGIVRAYGTRTTTSTFLERLIPADGSSFNTIAWTTGSVPISVQNPDTVGPDGSAGSITVFCDSDGDGVPNVLDLDSDNDGIFDVVEAGHNQSQTNGMLDGVPADFGNNGMLNAIETDDTFTANSNYTIAESADDTDTNPNFLDLDSDGDGIPDNVEAQTTVGYITASGTVNANGVDTNYTAGLTPENTDGTDNPDYLDLNSDNEGADDTTEAGLTLDNNDADGDGLDGETDATPTTGYADVGGTIDNPLSGTIILPDADADAATPGGDVDYRDATDDRTDTDNDGIPDVADLDLDNDGIPDAVECPVPAAGSFISISPADMGVTATTLNGGVNATEDLSANYGLPVGSIIVQVINGNAVGTTSWRVSPDYPMTFKFSGTMPVYLRTGHGSGLQDNGDRDGFVGDGQQYTATNTPEAGYQFSNIGSNYFCEVIDETLADGTQAMSWTSDGTTTTVRFYTSNIASFGSAVNIAAAPSSCDNDGDGIPNISDLDSDGDGISDIIEAGGTDADGDGQVDFATSGDPTTLNDTNNNGLDDTLEGTPLPVPNTDGTSGPDYLDIDADNDGIVDNIEGQTTAGYLAPSGVDADNDGIDDNYDGDNGNTVGVIDALGPNGDIVPTNTDGATDNPDYLDADSDDDGDLDSLEGWDTNNDGTPDTTPTNADADGDGLDNAYDTDDSNPDPTNGGTIPTDFPDLDIPGGDRDWRQALDIDWDGDGVDDFADLDSDNDGIPDSIESGGNDPYGDEDGDGIVNWMDTTDDGDAGDSSPTDYTDTDGNGIPDVYDQDGDGVPNHLDLDSDNDGIFDIVESGQLNETTILDANNDGVLDGNPVDFGANGLLDLIETDDTATATVAIPTADSDGDGIPDSNELDADNDGCNDVLEAGFTDGDNDGILGNTTGFTVNINGIVTSGVDGYTEPNDLDTNDVYDFQQAGVGVPLVNTDPVSQTIIINANVTFSTDMMAQITYQWYESTDNGNTWTPITDGNTNPVYSGATTDALTLTGVPESYNGYQYQVILSSPAFACDSNWTSAPATLNLFPDQDGDGTPDFSDLDSDNDGIPDTVESGGNDPYGDEDGDGIANWMDTTDDGDAGDSSPTDYTDADGNGIPDVYDTDGDGVPNHLDLDSDNDGIYDIVESGQLNGTTVVDLNNDGMLDGNPADFGDNGLLDLIETDDTATATVATPTADSDNDGIPDSLELDADNDGCNDVIEAGLVDNDDDGILGSNTGLTVDANGLVNTPGVVGYTEPNDLDNNDIFDFQEVGLAVQPIASQPQDQVIVVNANANFDVDLQNTITYQWQLSTDNGANWADISNGGTAPAVTGATSEELTLTFVPLEYNGYQYRVVLSSPAFACDIDVISDAALLTVYPDFDGDGVGDPIDLDDDNDGIPDTMEYPGITNPDPLDDKDLDGVPAYLDDNDNNISVGDTDGLVEPAYDFDGDGIANHFDLDADGDGIFDVVEAGLADLDGDNDGVIDGLPADFGINGLFDDVETNDTLLADINYVPWNSDGDSQLNFLDIDDDADGILTIVEGDSDFDSDSHPDYLDQDADDDGIPDNVEAQITAGYDNPTDVDANNDGLDDAYGPAGLTPVDTDGDNDPDYLDDDSDNDNVPDSTEGHDFGNNPNQDGEPDGIPDIAPSGTDSDNDGLDDAYDGSIGDFSDPNGLTVIDNPETDLPNRDVDLASVPGYDMLVTNLDREVDYRDDDDDGDGIPTIDEVDDVNGDPTQFDCDEDGIPNYLDVTSCTIVPQGFSPNADGDNDELVIPRLSSYENFEMEVYDRWGNLVYEYNRNGDTNPKWWDGYSSGTMTISKGNKVPVGTYYYIIKFNKGGEAPIAGWVYINY